MQESAEFNPRLPGDLFALGVGVGVGVGGWGDIPLLPYGTLEWLAIYLLFGKYILGLRIILYGNFCSRNSISLLMKALCNHGDHAV